MRNVEARRRVIRDLQKAIRRKEIENERMDIDLEEMALKVAERRNVSNPDGEFNYSRKESRSAAQIIRALKTRIQK